jgi:hypothetical protein
MAGALEFVLTAISFKYLFVSGATVSADPNKVAGLSTAPLPKALTKV